jgi:hypothetical protein
MTVERVPQDAVETVLAWAGAALAGDFPAMWQVMDANLRLCEAQLWVYANQEHPSLEGVDRDILADELAQITSEHPLWVFFQRDRLAAIRAHYIPQWGPERWWAAQNRRLVGEDLDVILIINPDVVPYIPADDIIVGSPTSMRAYLARFGPQGWQLAGFDYNVPVPGWPPSLGGPIER